MKILLKVTEKWKSIKNAGVVRKMVVFFYYNSQKVFEVLVSWKPLELIAK